MNGMEQLTRNNIREDGTAPMWIILCVRWTVAIIWAFHDYLFAPVFGRGDI
jgi:gliotoxin/aspirochlorine biosynthesis gamma-glutamylcyclotransferase